MTQTKPGDDAVKLRIKNCPFCGSPAAAFKFFENGGFRVECTNIGKCDVTENGATGYNRPAAIKNWNEGKNGRQWRMTR